MEIVCHKTWKNPIINVFLCIYGIILVLLALFSYVLKDSLFIYLFLRIFGSLAEINPENCMRNMLENNIEQFETIEDAKDIFGGFRSWSKILKIP